MLLFFVDEEVAHDGLILVLEFEENVGKRHVRSLENAVGLSYHYSATVLV